MASKKPSARERANNFIAQYGTAGGPIGAPGLIYFGAGDVARQIQSGNIDQYAAIRMANGGPELGNLPARKLQVRAKDPLNQPTTTEQSQENLGLPPCESRQARFGET